MKITATIDTTRGDNEVTKMLEKAKQVEFFYKSRTEILRENLSRIGEVVEQFHGNNLSIGNMYNSSIDSSHDKTSAMQAHGTFKMGKNYANKKLFSERINQAFKSHLPVNVHVWTEAHSVKDTETQLQIRIYPPVEVIRIDDDTLQITHTSDIYTVGLTDNKPTTVSYLYLNEGKPASLTMGVVNSDDLTSKWRAERELKSATSYYNRVKDVVEDFLVNEPDVLFQPKN